MLLSHLCAYNQPSVKELGRQLQTNGGVPRGGNGVGGWVGGESASASGRASHIAPRGVFWCAFPCAKSSAFPCAKSCAFRDAWGHADFGGDCSSGSLGHIRLEPGEGLLGGGLEHPRHPCWGR